MCGVLFFFITNNEIHLLVHMYRLKLSLGRNGEPLFNNKYAVCSMACRICAHSPRFLFVLFFLFMVSEVTFVKCIYPTKSFTLSNKAGLIEANLTLETSSHALFLGPGFRVYS